MRDLIEGDLVWVNYKQLDGVVVRDKQKRATVRRVMPWKIAVEYPDGKLEWLERGQGRFDLAAR